MPRDGNLSVDHMADDINPLFAAFNLHHLRSAFFHKSSGVANGFFVVYMIGAVRHVSDEKCVFDAAADGFYVMQHLVNRYRERVLVAKHGHGQGVADQDHINCGFVNQPRTGIVIRSQAGNWFVINLFFAEG